LPGFKQLSESAQSIMKWTHFEAQTATFLHVNLRTAYRISGKYRNTTLLVVRLQRNWAD
jgi:hypothetical protein